MFKKLCSLLKLTDDIILYQFLPQNYKINKHHIHLSLKVDMNEYFLQETLFSSFLCFTICLYINLKEKVTKIKSYYCYKFHNSFMQLLYILYFCKKNIGNFNEIKND